jgi:tetratricopeptide (TPR) repeat protein
MNILTGILFLFLSVLSFCQNSTAQNSEVAPNRRETILIVGVEHAPGQFQSEKFSPAHIRATLEAFKPQVVGVESNPEWFAEGQFYRSTYEAQHLAVPFARDNKIPVYGIDWIGNLRENDYSWRRHIERVRNIKKVLENPVVEFVQYQYGLSSWSHQIAIEDSPERDFNVLNGTEYGEKSLKWIDDGKVKKGSPQEYMEQRDNHIVDYIAAVANKHPGTRIAIVIGAMHKADLERKLRVKGFRVVGPQSVARTVPFSDGKKMDGLLKAQDIAAILAEAWDTTPQSGVRRERSERLLKRLLELSSKDPKAKAWGEYFSARHKMLEGNYAAAGKDFEKIERLENPLGFPLRSYSWRHHLTVQQAALFESGRIADLQGRRQEAIKRYERLLSSIKIPEYSEDIHSDYLFSATAYNAVRFLTQTAYSKALEAAENNTTVETTTFQVTTDASEKLQKAMNLGQVQKWSEATVIIEDVLRAGSASHKERCEGYIIAAYNYAMNKKTADAHRHLKSFDLECGNLPAGNWVFRERRQIDELLK